MTQPESLEFLETLCADPVGETAPAGQDVQYEPDFIALQAQIDKLSSPLERETFTWATVIDPAADILKHRSKDLSVAVYLSAALINTRRTAALKTGIRLVCDLLDVYWETGFPPVRRLKRREAAVHWWLERVGEALETVSEEIAFSTAELIDAELQRLQTLLNRRFPQTLFDVETVAGHIHRNAAKPPEIEPPDPDPTETVETSPEDDDPDLPELEETPCRAAAQEPSAEDVVQSPGPEAAPAIENKVLLDRCETIEDQRGIAANIRSVFNYMAEMARLLRERNPADEKAYSFARMAVYRRIRKPPLLKEGLTTILKPPPADRRRQLKELHEDQAWDDLLALSEKTLLDDGQAFYLDLNYYSAAALDALGEDYGRARKAVLAETGWFLASFPETLVNMAFRDGTPLASDPARRWMRCQVPAIKTGRPGAAEEAQKAPESETRPLDEQISALLSLPDTQSVLSQFRDRIRSGRSGCDAYAWTLGLVQYLHRMGRRDVMDGLLDEVETAIDRYRLEQWQPEAARRGLRVLHSVYSSSDNEDDRLKAAGILSRLAVLDICAAVDV